MKLGDTQETVVMTNNGPQKIKGTVVDESQDHWIVCYNKTFFDLIDKEKEPDSNEEVEAEVKTEEIKGELEESTDEEPVETDVEPI